MKWRADNKMETIHQEDWSDMNDAYGMRSEGYDRDGRPRKENLLNQCMTYFRTAQTV